MSLIIRRSLIFFVLLVAGLGLYSIWYGIKADKFEKTAVPYLESVMPGVTSWQYDQLEPLLSPSARRDFENKKLRAAYQSFSQLGRFQSMEKPRYTASRNDSSKEMGDIEVIDYEVVLQFDSGPAMIKIKLVADGTSYYVRQFGFHSEIFASVPQ
jgi:hypothetical protein